MSELKPCPFCGGEAKLWEGDWPAGDWGVTCSVCHICISPSELSDLEMVDGGKIAAAYLWNTRHPPAISAETVGRVREALISLRQKHYSCEDCWYSCPLSEDGCCDDKKPKECDCGADAENKIIEEALKLLPAPQDGGG